MKIYFNNNKYFPLEAFAEVFRLGNYYLSVNIVTAAPLNRLIEFFKEDGVLAKITIVDDENNVLLTLEDQVRSIHLANRSFGASSVTLEFSSSETGTED